MIRARAAILGICLAAVVAAGAGAQSAATAPDWGQLTRRLFTETDPLRFEKIAVGSLPLSLMYVGFAFDIGDWLLNGFSPTYAPWPFKSLTAPALSDSEKYKRLSLAALISLTVAVIDALFIPEARVRRSFESGKDPFPPEPPTLSEPTVPAEIPAGNPDP
ncbi:MAG: hypothetical protein WCQ50_20055 [Spirochaetota bacterium]